MDTLPLPPRPSLEQYRKRAKDLVTAAKSKDEGAVRAWADDWLHALARSLRSEITPFIQDSFDRAVDAIAQRVREKINASRDAGSVLSLADAQYLMARAHGFENWADFAHHVDGGERPPGQEFEAAVDAIVTGDLPALESLVRQHPELIRARSTRMHRATLLHYVAANGVEDFRQKTPRNAVAVARYLLEAGAEVDALAETYGGGKAQTTMNLLVSSTHPAQAGLQPALVETLLDFGAAIDGLEDNGSPLLTALAFGYIDAAETLAKRGARVDNVLTAAALGDLELVREFVVGERPIQPTLPGLHWLGIAKEPKAHLELAFAWACAYGRTAAVELLLDHGVHPSASDRNSMTGLHWAAANCHLEIVQLLLRRGAPLEVRNMWGGTVLGSTLHFAIEENGAASSGKEYAQVIDTLLRAGADVAESSYPTGNEAIDEVLRRHGAGAG